jgi:hypothetical protein
MRTVSGLIVPFGVPAYRAPWYSVQFAAGGLAVTDVARVPLMFEHAFDRTFTTMGVMTDVWERPDGVYADFALDDTDAGARAAAEFASGSRTGFSVGIQYDEATLAAIDAALDAWFWDDEDPALITGTGLIREASHTYMPAFDDARGAVTEPAEPVGA